jgi:hypothetical protein
MTSPERISRFSKCIWTAVLLSLFAGGAGVSGQRSGRASDQFPITTPVRRSADAVPALPPPLPSDADSVLALTFDLRVQVDEGGVSTLQEQTFSRTADRVHLKVKDGAEWLFVQNPRERTRLHAYLIDHEHKALIRHDESELRNGQQIRGWLDVLTLGFDPEGFVGLKATDQTTAFAGITFTRHVAGPAGAGLPGVHEVWWNDKQLLPIRIVSSTGRETRTVSVDEIRPGVDPALLSRPEDRFPSYRNVDLPDWLEER